MAMLYHLQACTKLVVRLQETELIIKRRTNEYYKVHPRSLKTFSGIPWLFVNFTRNIIIKRRTMCNYTAYLQAL